MPNRMEKQCVYRTNALRGYVYGTHRTDLVIDRKDSEATEVFFAILEPGQKSPLHEHRDCEQLWYILEGCGRLLIGEEDKLEEQSIGPGDVVLTRRFIHHSIENCGDRVLRYLAVDIFIGERLEGESTWDAHIEAFCQQHDVEVKHFDVTSPDK